MKPGEDQSWFEATAREYLEKYHLGNWSVRVLINDDLESSGRTTTNAEYLEADLVFNPKNIEERGLDAAAVVEHEVLHLCFLPLQALAIHVIRQFVTDARVREYMEQKVGYEEHQVLERIHRAFNKDAMVRTGKLGQGEE